MEDSDELLEPGSLLWAKVGSHPWWPCMIYFPPNGEEYYRSRGKSCTYHVQFLGPLVERAWVNSGNLIPFEGKRKFDEYVRDKLSTCKDKNERAKFDSKSTACTRDIWVQSWREAESSLNFTAQKRIEKFGRISVAVKSKRISKSEEESMLKMMSNVPLTVEEEAESLSNFLRRELDVRTEAHPEIDTKLLEEELRTQWPALDISTKRRYLEKQLGIFETDKSNRKSKSNANNCSSQKSGNVVLGRPSKKGTDSLAKREMDDREFDIEIHRLIVSPAQYRLQPVCPVCEVYSSAPGQMFKCRGPCGRMMHPSCMRYKIPPPAENNRPDRFRCPQCLTGEFLCSICGKPGDEAKTSQLGALIQCRAANCARRFHRDCVADWPGVSIRSNAAELKGTRQSNVQLLRCPAHVCNTCHLEECIDASPDTADSSGSTSTTTGDTGKPFLKCVRCPAVFHTGDLCTPAGSVEVSLSDIVCPRHFDEALNGMPHFRSQHPNWCFKCFTSSGERVFCAFCPTSYHANCLEPSFGKQSGEKFICRSCRQGFFPRYAQIIWAKIPQFRWWPCEIIHARNAPINILNMTHPEGTFPIRFLGSDEYQWISRCCVLPYETGLKTSAAKDYHGSKSVDKAFTRALARSPKGHQVYVNHVLKCGLPLISMHADPLPDDELLPSLCTSKATVVETADGVMLHERLRDQMGPDTVVSSFTSLQANIYASEDKAFLQRVAGVSTSRTPAVCTCKVSSGGSTCAGRGDECENMQWSRECDASNCSWKDKDCGNRLFARLQSVAEAERVRIRRTVNRGYGLKLLMPVNKGDLVLEYCGEVIDVDEANRRILDALGPTALATLSSARKGCRPERETYLARLGSQRDFVIDAGSHGSMARFVNHSCEPNLLAKCSLVQGRPRLGLFALRSIAVGEELTLHYPACQFLSTGMMGATCLCLCGTDSCVSTLRLPLAFQPVSDSLGEGAGGREQQGADQLQLASSEHRRRGAEKSRKSGMATPSLVKAESVDAAESTKKNSSVSVVNLLAAATSNALPRRDHRPLIQPSVLAARAAEEAKRQKAGGTGSTSISTGAADVSAPASGRHASAHEDFCYRCGDGGELVLCDRSTCSKAFHLHCLGLSSPPSGIWYCPWHYCDVCGHPSSHLCWRCPNSYCQEHASDRTIQIDQMDRVRWEAVKSSLESIKDSSVGQSALVSTVPVLVSSFHWICSDHAGISIHGPEHRPWLWEPPRQNDAGANGTDSAKAADTCGGKAAADENLPPDQVRIGVGDENKSGKREHSAVETKRVEPLKVTLKRKLKAELAANKVNQDLVSDCVPAADQLTDSKAMGEVPHTVTDTPMGDLVEPVNQDSVRNRKRSASVESPAVVDKKRQRMSRDSYSVK